MPSSLLQQSQDAAPVEPWILTPPEREKWWWPLSVRMNSPGALEPRRSHAGGVEPPQGFEPWTCGLRNRCSTTELRRPEAAAACVTTALPLSYVGATGMVSRAPSGAGGAHRIGLVQGRGIRVPPLTSGRGDRRRGGLGEPERRGSRNGAGAGTAREPERRGSRLDTWWPQEPARRVRPTRAKSILRDCSPSSVMQRCGALRLPVRLYGAVQVGQLNVTADPAVVQRATPGASRRSQPAYYYRRCCCARTRPARPAHEPGPRGRRTNPARAAGARTRPARPAHEPGPRGRRARTRPARPQPVRSAGGSKRAQDRDVGTSRVTSACRRPFPSPQTSAFHGYGPILAVAGQVEAPP